MADKWAEWLLSTRFGGDPNSEGARLVMKQLTRIRNSLLDFAYLKPGEIALDVGCGDGLMGFGALDRTTPSGRTFFLDISHDLLQRCREIGRDTGMIDRCSFVRASAERLPLRDECVDLVTTRSVLIYVQDKDAALSEFRRVLRPKGRIALFETLLALEFRDEDRIWPGFGLAQFKQSEIAPVHDLVDRLITHDRKFHQSTASMTAFGHKDWFFALDRAGFAGIHANLSVSQGHTPPVPWDSMLKMSLNPLVPTLGEMIQEVFSTEERERFEAHMRLLIESGGGVSQMSNVNLWAWKNTPSPRDLDLA
jgi:ubiquinone/menaquinone biosynthesis C-methylase UbiE